MYIFENKKLSPKKLAEETGLSIETVKKICDHKEKKLDLKTFLSIAHACGWELSLENRNKTRKITLPASASCDEIKTISSSKPTKQGHSKTKKRAIWFSKSAQLAKKYLLCLKKN